MIANNYFIQNLENLKLGYTHKARAKYQDGEDAYKTSIYQVFEKYPKGVLPIHTMRETAIKSAIQEMLWIYKDQSNRLEDAHKRDIYWWDDFNVGDDTIGQAYGHVVDKYESLYIMLDSMVFNPFSQRHVLSLWDEYSNEYQDSVKGLVPCAFLTQYSIIQQENRKVVNMHLQIRSSDYITAGAINRIQYYCLGLMICGHLTHETGEIHELGDFSVFTQDLHVYDRHEFAVDELLSNNPIDENWSIKLNGIKSFYKYDIEDFIIKKPKGLYKLSQKLEIAV